MKTFLLIFLLSFHPIIFANDNLPLEYFASTPDVRGVKISPNGKLISSLVRINSKDKKGTALVVTDLASGKKEYPLFADNITLTLDSAFWANDNILLIKASFPESRYGVATTETRLMMYDLAKKKTSNVLSKAFIERLYWIPNVLTNVIDILPNDPNHILLSMAGFGNSADATVVKVSFDRGGKTTVVKAIEKDVQDWLVDQQHNVRIGYYLKDTSYRIYEHAANDVDKRRVLWEFEALSEDEVWPLGFDLEPNILFVKALHKGFDAVFKVNLNDPELKKELVYSEDGYDVGGHLKYSKATGKAVGFGSFYWDKKFNRLQKILDKSIPNNTTEVLSYSADDNHYIAFSSSDLEPGIYILGNRDKNTMGALAYKYKNLTPDMLTAKQTISYQTRDGLKIEGFLTLPKSKSKKMLPTVIFPHGGPIAFDDNGFDYWTQFLASRGYAVLQMNFRGSEGYGFDFMKMGVGNWGKSMQDDVEDGSKWLIKQGIADPKHICILGASYGGYAALMGAIKSPDLYQCAISFAGVTNLNKSRDTKAYANHELNNIQLGDDYDDREQRSPNNHANKITIPVLLIHGTKDRSAKIEQSELMFNALKSANKDVELVILDNGDHYLSNEQHRVKTFKAIEGFLAKHL